EKWSASNRKFLAGLISELSRSSWSLQEGSLQARNRIGARLVRSWQSPLTCRFPASSATAFRFDRSRDAVVSIPPYAARTTIANNPASPATARVFMTVLHHAGQRELLSYLSKRG